MPTRFAIERSEIRQNPDIISFPTLRSTDPDILGPGERVVQLLDMIWGSRDVERIFTIWLFEPFVCFDVDQVIRKQGGLSH